MPNDRYRSKKELEKRSAKDAPLFDRARHSATDPTVVLPAGSPTEPLAQPQPTAQVERVSRRLGKDPDELARAIPPDTLRRTRYPLIEREEEEGGRTFRHDLGIVEGAKGLIQKQITSQGDIRESGTAARRWPLKVAPFGPLSFL